MKEPLIYLHLGLHKTGSTSIQNFLCANQKKLIGRGVLYPKAGRLNNSDGHHNFAWEINKDERLESNVSDQWNNLAKEIMLNKPNLVVISSEDFEKFNLEEIRVLKNKLMRYQVKIIIYLRRQDKWHQSLYKQLVKTGNTYYSFNEYLDINNRQRKNDYYELLKMWEIYSRYVDG